MLIHKLHKVTGGAEVFFLETARILREAGHEVFLVATGDPQESTDHLLLLEAPFYQTSELIAQIANLPRSVYDPAKKQAILRLIDDFQPDIIHAFDFHVHLTVAVLSAANERGVPVVLTCNDYRHICPNYKLYHHNHICLDCRGERFRFAIGNRCCKSSLGLSVASALIAYVHRLLDIYGRYVDVFTFSSDFMASMTRTFWPNRDFLWGKLRNPFNSLALKPVEEYADYGLYFGRLIEEKGVDRLLRASSDINGFPIKIVGAGPDGEMLKDMARGLGLNNVEFLGPLWGADLDGVLKRARFVVVPSVWHENFPYVILQSFAYARPVIGSHRGGITELVEHGKRGFIYEAEDIPSLAAAIRDLAENPARAAALGGNAKIYSDDVFRDDVYYTDLMQIYSRASDARSGARR